MSRRSATTTKVFVGNLPANATTKDLRELFAPYGEIAECDIAIRCGFLHLEDRDLAMKAIEELNNTMFMGVRISVEKGRVKPLSARRGGGGLGSVGVGVGGGRGGPMGAGPIRGGVRDRNGPYSRDNLGRPPRAGYDGDRGYGYDDRYRYDAGGHYDEYGADRRSMYDDRGVMDPYARAYSNGYTYDDRAYADASVAYQYGDRSRMAAAMSGVGYDDRYAAAMGAERRAALDQSQQKAMQAGYERSEADMYSRRDGLAKAGDRAQAGYTTAPAGYGVAPQASYGQSAGWVAGGGYGDGRPTASVGYDTRGGSGGAGEAGAYGDGRAAAAAAMAQGYDARAMTAQMAAGAAYPDGRQAAGATAAAGGGGAMASYSTAAVAAAAVAGYGTVANYNTVPGSGYESYGATTRNGGNYDASYPPLPQQKSYATGGAPVPRRDMPQGQGRRY